MRSHLCRYFGLVITFNALYIVVPLVASELYLFTSGGGGALSFKRTRKANHNLQHEDKGVDEEKAVGRVEKT